jgi:hypothetical protein
MRAPVALVVAVIAGVASAATPAVRCERSAAAALRTCVKQASVALRQCHAAAGGGCAASDATMAPALARLESRVRRACPDGGTVQAVGWGPLLDAETLPPRFAESCRGEALALAARAFGGPQGAALAAATGAGRLCLNEAHAASDRLVERSFKLRSKCILRVRRGADCDASSVMARVAREHDAARTRVAAQCPALETLVATVTDDFLGRAADQADCLLATAHPNAAPFVLGCGPRAAAPPPARDTPTQVVLDEATWGSRCGDGSPYAFQIRLAPAGEPAENVVVFLQGGGVCVFEEDCAAVSTGLLNALDNPLPSGGILSNDPAVNPFAAWTKVFLPYCTQDIHVGGGTTSAFPSRTVHRFGARNVRAALRWVRDALWAELDATTAEGYRADRPRVVLSGGSAGGFGASYNYHWVLDDLRWPRTTAVPDSALGLDNGELLGVASLGFFVLTNDAAPLGWGSRPYLPPYCFNAACAVVPILQAETAARLGGAPEQAILNVSNQVDTTQVDTTFFATTAQWIDAARASYCANRGLPGLRWFLPAVPSHIHGMVANTPRFTTLASDGVVLRDWLADGIGAPGSLVDRVEEGSLTTSHGANPFPCALD